jgi:heme-degrading monooxygenase HmoA
VDGRDKPGHDGGVCLFEQQILEHRMIATRRTTLCALAGVSAAGWAAATLAAEGPVLVDKPKIARIWHGRTPVGRADEYRQYLFDAGVKKIASIPGNRGVQIMMRKASDEAEFMVVSYWDSIDAIKGYAGATYERVHDLPRDNEFLIDKETLVRHFELDVNFWQG